MSDIYVKWSRLKRCSGNLKNYSKRTAQIAMRVNGIGNSLKMSTESDDAVRRRLQYDTDKIYSLARDIERYSSLLESVASLYEQTEKSNADR